ncbi:HNH endonuclease [Bacillus cereus]|uniref:HNH endonuclease n=1 Tax=Bacillus cereus TaxID=1396 RepID=UPI0025A07E1F|nr:HNH endonuclease [Bacillus cereus]MDM5235197.1 HNH endonuclease [Bacillus cereus]
MFPYDIEYLNDSIPYFFESFEELRIKLEMNFLNKNYDVLYFDTRSIKQKNYLESEPSAPRVCRFCGKSQNEVNFKKDAHAIPHMLGNQYLLSKYECDVCNQYFSKLENDLGNYTLFIRSIQGQRGKRSYPKFKRNGIKVETVLHEEEEKQKKRLKISNQIGSNRVKEHEETNSMIITGEKDAYTPIAVYKCLVKVALTLMPDTRIKYFSKSIKWILEKDHSKGNPKSKLLMFESLISPRFFESPFVFLHLRKENAITDLPYAICKIYFGYFMYQFYIPMCEKDKNKNLGFRPLIIESGVMRNNRLNLLDLSSPELRKGEKTELEMSYEEKKPAPKELLE